LSPIAASSATYRTAVNKVARSLREPAEHGPYPSEDFEAITDLIDPKSRERALEWYKRGIRRGLIQACNAMLRGELELKGSTLYCPADGLAVSVRVKFIGEPWEQQKFEFPADELDFK
jgi:hypothetical protein